MNFSRQELPGKKRQSISSPGGTIEDVPSLASVVPPGLGHALSASPAVPAGLNSYRPSGTVNTQNKTGVQRVELPALLGEAEGGRHVLTPRFAELAAERGGDE